MIRLIERSLTPVLSIEDAAKHIRRTDTTEDDELIELYIDAATRWAENFTGRTFIDTVWDYYLDAFPQTARSIRIPKPPLIEIIEVVSSGVAFTDYLVDYSEPSIYLAATSSWPTTDIAPNAVRIRFRAGYIDDHGSPGPTGAVPEDIRIAIAIYTANLYENRESITTGVISQVPWSAEQLLRMRRVEDSMA